MSPVRSFVLCLSLLLSACVGNTYGTRGISETLAGRTVYFAEPGETKSEAFWQSWAADGTTRTGGPSVFHDKSGRWKVVNGTYCEIFGRAKDWRCWRITLSEKGQTIRFWEIPDELGDVIFFHRDMTGRFAD
jgi:hypothetical protein